MKLAPAPNSSKANTVGKYCSIYRTMGERRLASHLLVGLEMLLPLLIPNIDSKTALSFLPKERREKYVYSDKNKVKKTMRTREAA
jgi:hypothetical protein